MATAVRAGENRGATLKHDKHDYVVRDWIGPLALTADAKGSKSMLTRSLAVPAGAVPKNLGIAAFVQTEKGEVLQALALPLCSG